MAITYSLEVKENLLLVKAAGRDDDVNDVIQYGQALIEAAVQAGCTRVLCDERELEYAIGTLDIYQSASMIAQTAPHIARVAIVCNPQFLKEGEFWETVAVNRGLMVRMFTEMEEARDWLESLLIER